MFDHFVLTIYKEQTEMDNDFILQENSYRKGYYNGYERALLDVQAMINMGYPPDQTIMTSLEYVIVDLKDWRYGDPSKLVLPPQLNPSKWNSSSTLNNNINTVGKNAILPTRC